MLLKLIYIYYGILIPGWKTFRAVANGQNHFIILWLKYWVIFALLQGLGFLTDVLFGGSPLYALLKLVMAVILWIGYPDSTNIMYKMIDKPALRNLELNLANQGYRGLGQQLFHFFWSPDPEENQEDHRSELPVNAKLLKRELSLLMASIAAGDTANRDSNRRQSRNRNQGPMERRSFYNINYLKPRYRVHYSEDDQSDSM